MSLPTLHIIDTLDDVAYLDRLTAADLDLILDDAQRAAARDAMRRALPESEAEAMCETDCATRQPASAADK